MSSTQVKISVPANHLMAALLGERDEVLRAIEASFPGVGILVRGNEITLDGEDAERVGALFEDLVVLVGLRALEGEELVERQVARVGERLLGPGGHRGGSLVVHGRPIWRARGIIGRLGRTEAPAR